MDALGWTQYIKHFLKINKEYIVDVDAEEHYPKASLVFAFDKSLWSTTVGITQVDGKTFAKVSKLRIS